VCPLMLAPLTFKPWGREIAEQGNMGLRFCLDAHVQGVSIDQRHASICLRIATTCCGDLRPTASGYQSRAARAARVMIYLLST
jgi:hypothetical protein